MIYILSKRNSSAALKYVKIELLPNIWSINSNEKYSKSQGQDIHSPHTFITQLFRLLCMAIWYKMLKGTNIIKL